MRIISQSRREEFKYYRMSFDYVGHTGSGFAFECNENGVVDESSLNPVALENYRACLTGKVGDRAVNPGQLVSWTNAYRHPAEGECDCGETVLLEGFTNTCEKCGADYNMSGQRLAPREQWGWECNETAADILRGGDPFDTDY